MDFGGWPEKEPAVYEAEREVIEAAKALRVEAKSGESASTYAAAEWRLFEAVEALEKGEE